MMRSFAIAALMLTLSAGTGVCVAQDTEASKAADPSKLIEDCANRMLKDLDAHRAEYRKDPSKVNKLVDDVLLPHFDTQYAARLVLGRYWRDASQDQRQRFIDAFYKSLLENYGSALVEFTADRMKVLPYQGDPASDRATVRTEVKRSDGTRVPVNYSMRKTDEGWKAWDVTIEGISYVKNFRTQYGAEIDQKGLDAVIKRLETEGVKPAPTGKPATPAKTST
ncbi:MAG TPA: ABC transporter substrate-binding protein [Steroidobacteraceae bacterium]|nr:ABC transporter substrate-binding protein [Steroidobacteraceae bacterium]